MTKLSDKELLETLSSMIEKLDRCAKIAKRKYDTFPSAYAGGAIAKCRDGKIWKGLKEEQQISEVLSQDEAKENLKNAEKELTIAKNSVKTAEEKLRLAQDMLRAATKFKQRAASGITSPSQSSEIGTSILNTLSEAVYQGNLGMMEVYKFMTEAPEELRLKFKELLDAGLENEAWDMVKKFTHSELTGIGTLGSSKNKEELDEEDAGLYEGIDEEGNKYNIEMLYEDRDCGCEESLEEAEYKGRKVALNKPMRGDVKKFKVFVKDPKTGNVKKVNFGDPNMRIKKSNPARRKSFRARHHCENPGPKTKARYWACRSW